MDWKTLLRSVLGKAGPDLATMPLSDVWSLARTCGGLIVDREQAGAFLRSVESTAPVDREWRASPSNPHPYIAVLEDVILIPGTRILLDGKGNAFSDEICAGFGMGLPPKPRRMQILDGPRLVLSPPPLSRDVIPAGVHLTGEHETNYFHWFVEILTRLYLYLQLTQESEAPLLVSEGLHDNLHDLLRLVCGPDRPIRRLRKDRCHRVKRLVYPGDVSRILDVYDRPPSHETTYLPVGLIHRMTAAIRSAAPPARNGDTPKRLFVKRTARYRTLLNEAEVQEFLVSRGFHAVDPGGLSVRDQMEIFAGADVIVGPSGAAFTNMAWCHAGACILVLHSDHPFKKYPYWDGLARASGAQISYLSGPRGNRANGVPDVHDDFRIPVEDLRRALTEID